MKCPTCPTVLSWTLIFVQCFRWSFLPADHMVLASSLVTRALYPPYTYYHARVHVSLYLLGGDPDCPCLQIGSLQILMLLLFLSLSHCYHAITTQR